MSGWALSVPASLIVIGWVLTGRILVAQSRKLGELRERVAFLEAKVNGLSHRQE